ncbi:MAG: sialate O-acetylesterase, partial [Candidatus Marinimicrobia bacterium]|nr:sialate O-acetylesterase [Candidatus Neomarinimicrobiota bacterium]
GLVVNARGGSEIEEWAQGSKFYQDALRRVSEAQKTGVLKGILWHQGEANVENPDKYIDKLTKLVTQFRQDLDMPELPFIAGQIDGVHPINEQTAMLPDRLPFTGFVSSEGLTIFEEWHFDAASVRLMGKRYAEEMLKIQNQGNDQMKK